MTPVGGKEEGTGRTASATGGNGAAGTGRRARVTISDVARAAQVDPSVVSRVINGDERLVIKPETRERVVQAIRDLNYHPNAAARSLRISQAGTVGLLIPDFANPIYARIIQGAEAAATQHDTLLLVGSTTEGDPDRYVAMLASGRVDGLLLAVDSLPPSTIEALARTGRPIVSVNQRIPGVEATILADDEAASRMAVKALWDLGHRRIAHLRGPSKSDTAGRRLAGFRKSMRALGVGAAQAPVVGGGYTTDAGFEAVDELLALPVRPTAVVVANVAAAIGALTALRLAKVRVPQDISLIAIHDIPLADHLTPALSTVSLPLTEIGAAAVGLLSGADRQAAAGVTIVKSPMTLIERESTAPA